MKLTLLPENENTITNTKNKFELVLYRNSLLTIKQTPSPK